MPVNRQHRNQLLEMFRCALQRVRGDSSVAAYLSGCDLSTPVYLVAIGKAASAMAQGARRSLGEKIVRGLVITKDAHLDYTLRQDSRLTCMESGHPLPDERSLQAGAQLLRFLAEVPADASILFLLSGGTSSLLEVLPAGVSLKDLQRLNGWLLGSGLDIARMNAVRKSVSMIKGGRLSGYLGPQRVLALLISDVPGDDVATIGSGLLRSRPLEEIDMRTLPEWVADLCQRAHQGQTLSDVVAGQIEHHIVATNHDALQAVCGRARELGCPCTLHNQLLQGDAVKAGRDMAHLLRAGAAGIHVWGGETTVHLPQNPGRGGRNQSLALAAAIELQGVDDIYLLAAGSDGSDGPGEDAGALVDGATITRGRLQGLDAEMSLSAADAGTFLEASGDLVYTGPTGTNVMDIVIGLKV